VKSANTSGGIIVKDYLINNRFKIIVKPNSKKTEILGYDKDKIAKNFFGLIRIYGLTLNASNKKHKGKRLYVFHYFFQKQKDLLLILLRS